MKRLVCNLKFITFQSLHCIFAIVYLSMARSTFRSAALGPVRKFLMIVSALLSKERAPSTALEHSLRTKSSVTKSGQFYNKNKRI